jgi:hypothetical protein
MVVRPLWAMRMVRVPRRWLLALALGIAMKIPMCMVKAQRHLSEIGSTCQTFSQTRAVVEFRNIVSAAFYRAV